MAKQVQIGLAILVVALFGFAARRVLVSREPDPIVAGKPLTFWLENYSSQYVLERAMRQAGTNAIPTLLRMLRQHDSPFRVKVMDVAQRQSLVSIDYFPDKLQNRTAWEAFQELGASAKGAVPELMEIYRQGISESSQAFTARSLGAVGPAAKEAIPMLLSSATKASALVRSQSLMALGDIHSEPTLVLPGLTDSLKSSNAMVRLAACAALARFGTEAGPALPALAQLLNAPERYVRARAAIAMRSIDPAAVPGADTNALPATPAEAALYRALR